MASSKFPSAPWIDDNHVLAIFEISVKIAKAYWHAYNTTVGNSMKMGEEAGKKEISNIIANKKYDNLSTPDYMKNKVLHWDIINPLTKKTVISISFDPNGEFHVQPLIEDKSFANCIKGRVKMKNEKFVIKAYAVKDGLIEPKFIDKNAFYENGLKLSFMEKFML